MKFNIIISIVVLLFVSSCSDNPTKQTESFDYKEYMPLRSNNYWSYDYFGIGKDGEQYLSRYAFDSVFVKDTILYNGRNATIMSVEENNQGKISNYDIKYSLDSSQISFIGFPLVIDDTVKFINRDWVILYDLYKSSWSSQYISLNDSLINGIKYNGAISFEGSNRGNTKIEYDGNLIKTISTYLKIIYNLEKKNGSKVTQLKQFENYEFKFAKGIGLVYTKYQKFQDSILVGGYEKVITGYKK